MCFDHNTPIYALVSTIIDQLGVATSLFAVHCWALVRTVTSCSKVSDFTAYFEISQDRMLGSGKFLRMTKRSSVACLKNKSNILPTLPTLLSVNRFISLSKQNKSIVRINIKIKWYQAFLISNVNKIKSVVKLNKKLPRWNSIWNKDWVQIDWWTPVIKIHFYKINTQSIENTDHQ